MFFVAILFSSIVTPLKSAFAKPGALTESVYVRTGRVIQVCPGSFPRAHSLNAWPHLRLQHFELTEKSAMEGTRLADKHHHPELEFVAGLALLGKHGREGATKHFEAYLGLAPRGVDAALAPK